jgi:hypothetical protein
VGGRCTVRWFPARVLAGLHTSARYATAGDTVRVGCLAVDPVADAAVPGRPLELRISRRVGRRALEEFARGRFRWRSDWADTLVERRFLVSGEEPVTVPWPLTHPGTYRFTLAAEDARGKVSRSELRVTATGRRWVRWRHGETPELELAVDKDLYRVGDTARVVLESPVRGNWALVTVEADSVLSTRVVDLRTYPGYFTVPIQASYWPNVFMKVHVLEPALTRTEAPDLDDAERLPISLFGQVNLPLDLSDNRLDVAVYPDRKTYAPGDSVAITVRVSGPKAGTARVSLAVVDRAVLALREKKPPDPFSRFCRERRNAVGSWSSATALRNPRKLTSTYSSASMRAGAGYSPFGSRFPVRKEFATTAYWNPALVTDATGTARATFVLPDNLTEYEVLAVAMGTDAFGVGESGFVVNRPLVLEPVLPRFVGVGDTVHLAVQVTNATAGVLKGTIRAQSTLRLLGTDARTVRVEAGEGALAAFPAVCLLPDSARVRFTGDFGYVGDAVESALPVRDPRVEVAAAFAGITDGTAGETIALPGAAIPGTETLNLALAASPLAGADQAFAYVMDYPYGCLEQTASRLLALTLYRGLLTKDRLPDMDRKIHYTVRRLQRDFGEEAGFWPGARDRHFDHATYFRAYATFALLLARKHPAVSDSLLELNLRNLNAVWDHGPHIFSTDGWERDNPRGFVAFVISEGKRAGLTTGSDATLLHGLARELPYWSGENRVFGALALINRSGAGDTTAAIWERAADRLRFTARDATCPSLPGSLPGAFRTEIRATALALLLGTRTAPPGDPRLDLLAQGLIRLQRNGHWRTTHDNVFALLALTVYQGSRGCGDPMTAAVLLDGTETLKNRFHAGSRYLFRRSIPVRGLAGTPGSRLEFRVEEGGPVYYTGTLRWDESVVDRHPREGGLSLVRRIQSLGGSETPRLGDPVAVILEIAVERECAYLALRNPLPAGLEAIQPRFLPEPGVPAWRFSRAPAAYPCLPVTHVETLDAEVRIFTGRVPPGVYEYRYAARVRAAGTFVHPPATVEAMYEPEFSAASGASRFTVPGP